MKEKMSTVAPIQNSANISPHAVIHPSAIIHDDVEIGPWTLVGPNVEIGSGTQIFAHVVIEQNTKIGRNNKIHAFAHLGGDPQDSSYQGEETFLEIGDSNIFREYVTISRGSARADGMTRVGNRNTFLAYSHVGHDSKIGNEVLFVNNATVAGHVTVDDYAVLGAHSAVHQFCHIGSYAFITESNINRDVMPYVLVTGQAGEVHGLNVIGLQRRGFSEKTIRELKRSYSVIFRRGLKRHEIVIELKKMLGDTPEIKPLLDLIENSERGFMR